MSDHLEIIVGTYEQFLLGYTVGNVVNEYKMKQSFAIHSHVASIRCVVSNKHYLASAAADDTVCLYDMQTRTENGKLMHHNGTINSMSFTADASHLITTSTDGTIGIIRCGNWQLEKHWLKPHKGLSVDALAIHPTGKIAMTTGHDGVLRTWNLVKGRQAYATNLVHRWKIDATNISILKWSPNGSSYFLSANHKIDVYSLETAGVKVEVNYKSKISCVEYLNEDHIVVGLTNGKINIYNIKNKMQCNEIQAHTARVKCLSTAGELLISAASSGEIKLWSNINYNLILLSEINCNCRISCLTLSKCEKLNTKEKEKKDTENMNVLLLGKLKSKKVVIEIEHDEEEKKKICTKTTKRKASTKHENALGIEINTFNELLNKQQISDKSKVIIEQNLKKNKNMLLSKSKRKIASDSLNKDIENFFEKKTKILDNSQKNLTTNIQNKDLGANKKKRKALLEDDTKNFSKLPKQVMNVVEKRLFKKKQHKYKNRISR